MQRGRTFIRSYLLVALSVSASAGFLAHRVHAIDGVQLSVESAQGAQWRANGITTEVHFRAHTQRVVVRIEELQPKALGTPLRDISIECNEVQLQGAQVRCDAAQIHAVIPGLGAQRFSAAFSYDRSNDSVTVQARDLRIGGGRMSAQLSLLSDAWKVNLELESASLAALDAMLQEFDLSLPLQIVSGDLSARISAAGMSDQVSFVEVDANVRSLSANNEAGSLASEALDVAVQARMQHQAQTWTYDMELSSAAGQAYAQPVFLDLSAHSLNLQSHGQRAADGTIQIQHFDLKHDGVSAAHGQALIDPSQAHPVRELELELDTVQFPAAYDSYLQPLMLESSFKAVRSAGRIEGSLSVRSGDPQRLDLRFHDLDVDVNASAMAIEGLQGHWQWRADDLDEEDVGEPSRIAWSGGALFGLSVGASVLEFSTQARNFRLLEPARIPLLDGALQLESLRARNVGLPSVAFMIDAEIQPLSVQRLSAAFGWPEFGGSLAGTISKLRMRDGVLTLGTTLHARVFDGEVRVSDLKLEQPFGKWPRFYSNIALDKLDLELVTSAFSFGRITGRLSGEIQGLELFAWSPIAFDAKLYTPPGDRSRRRISQRAVENIGSIGGGGAGVTAALSSGFLRFFEEFNYAQLGISCRLRNEVCEMNGAAPAPKGGYYLVQGRGLPRIDVIGNSRRVDWPRLVQQLIAATESSGPVVD
jgi:hypothetical protein